MAEKFITKAPKSFNKKATQQKTKKLLKHLSDMQNILYAQSKYSVLIVMQGLDAAGKDGAIKNIFSGVNPMGCSVTSFKAPTKEELSHDFLWRIHKVAPAKGMIQIFNRSHYEDVLVPVVEKWIDKKEAKKRFETINSFEKSLQQHNNTVIFKFFLNISKEKQKEKFQERLTDPSKRWKYNPEDMKAASKYEQYLSAYKEVVKNCSPKTPWTIVPSDQNWYKEYIIAKTLVDGLKKLKLEFPKAKV
jgi:PPK2 family polyphosphate:nucleotide phosphotransferase